MPLANYGNLFSGLAQGIESGTKLPMTFMNIKNAQAEREMAGERLGLAKKQFGLEQQKAEREKSTFEIENRAIGLNDALKIADAYGTQSGDTKGADQLKTEIQSYAMPDGKIRIKDLQGINAKHIDFLKATAPEKASGIGVYNRFTNKVLIPETKQPTGGIEGLRLESFVKEAGGDPVKGRQLYDQAKEKETKAGEAAAMARTVAAQKEPTGNWEVKTVDSVTNNPLTGETKIVKIPSFKINSKTGEERPLDYAEKIKAEQKEVAIQEKVDAFIAADKKDPKETQNIWDSTSDEQRNIIKTRVPQLAAKYDNKKPSSDLPPKRKPPEEKPPEKKPEPPSIDQLRDALSHAEKNYRSMQQSSRGLSGRANIIEARNKVTDLRSQVAEAEKGTRVQGRNVEIVNLENQLKEATTKMQTQLAKLRKEGSFGGFAAFGLNPELDKIKTEVDRITNRLRELKEE